MKTPKLSKLELQIMEVLWDRGGCCIRDVLDAFPGAKKPAYTTIQTMVYRLEEKDALRRIRKISNAHIFEPTVDRDIARHGLLDDILSLFGGRAQPMVAQLAEAGKLSLEDVREIEEIIRKRDRQHAKKPRRTK